jgi:hypothetical protein
MKVEIYSEPALTPTLDGEGESPTVLRRVGQCSNYGTVGVTTR